MTHTFEPGDAVMLTDDRGVTRIEVIVDHQTIDGDVFIAAYREIGREWHAHYDQKLRGWRMEPHPDSDAVLASYTAWILTHGAD